MPFQAYNHMLIVDQPIQNYKAKDVTVGYEFKLQYPSYRGTFLSCIEDLVIKVDGQELNDQETVFLLNDKQFLLSELKECFKEYWFVLDYATIRVIKPGGLAPGKHTVNVFMKHRIPYTGYFGQYLVMDADETKQLDVQ
jgi:hypothetical protein